MCERGASTWRERLEQAGKECLDKEKWSFFLVWPLLTETFLEIERHQRRIDW